MLFFKQERKSSYGDIPKKIVIGKIKDEKGNIIRAGCSKRIDENGRFEIIFDPLGAGTDTYTLIDERGDLKGEWVIADREGPLGFLR